MRAITHLQKHRTGRAGDAGKLIENDRRDAALTICRWMCGVMCFSLERHDTKAFARCFGFFFLTMSELDDVTCSEEHGADPDVSLELLLGYEANPSMMVPG